MSTIEVRESLPTGIAQVLPHEEVPGVIEELRLAAAVVEAFVKVVKGYRYYPADYPLHNEFQRELFDRLWGYLEQHYSLLLHVSELTFSVDGHVIYSTSDLKSSVPFLLYRDGIRELLFTEGVEEPEVMGLVEILTRCDKADRLEDDLVTLLWEKELAHIEYLAVDDFMEQAEAIPESVEELRERLFTQAETGSEATELWDAGAGGNGMFQEAPPAGLLDSLMTNSDIYRLTPDELHTLQQEIEEDSGPTGAVHLAATLFDLLAIEEDRALFNQMAIALQTLLGHLLDGGEFRLTADLLARTETARRGFALQDWRTDILRQVMQSISHPAHLQAIGRYLKANEGEQLEQIGALLNQMPPSAVPSLVHLLGETRESQTREMLCDVLVQVGAADAHLFAPFLDDSRNQLVLDLIRILGRIGHENIVSYLARAIQHRDPLVRRTVVRATAGIHGEHAERLLIKALADADENVRAQAATQLGSRHTPTAFTALLRVVQEKGFENRGPGEVRAFLDGVGVSGTNAALDVLKRLLLRKSWFERRRADAIRQHAAHALAMIGTPEAVAVLNTGKDDRDIVIRQACGQALKALRQ